MAGPDLPCNFSSAGGIFDLQLLPEFCGEGILPLPAPRLSLVSSPMNLWWKLRLWSTGGIVEEKVDEAGKISVVYEVSSYSLGLKFTSVISSNK